MSERLFRAVRAVLVAATVCCSSSLLAQTASDSGQKDSANVLESPHQQFGFGASTVGFHIQYSLESTVHIGLYLHLDLNSYDSASTPVSFTSYEIGPYIKYLLMERPDVVPYVQASLMMIRPGHFDGSLIEGSGRKDSHGEFPGSEMRLTVGFGAEHFFGRHLGVYAQVQFIHAFLSDPTSFHTGLVGSVVGAEFFF